MKIPILELFGPTIQGEGMVIGKKTLFIRTSGCDYRCAWCDSSFTWDGTGKPTMMTPEQIITQIDALNQNRARHVTLSGGNPAIHKGLGEVVDRLHASGYDVAIETQGTIWNDWLTKVDEITISPKPPSSTMTTDFQQLASFIERLPKERTTLKVVVFDEKDFQFAEKVHQTFPTLDFYIQPGNDDLQETDERKMTHHLIESYERLIERAMASTILKDVRILPQLHALVWGNRRGV